MSFTQVFTGPRWPAGTQPRPADYRRPWRGRPRRAHAPRATARIPPWRRAGRFAEAAAGSGCGPAVPGLAALVCGPGRPARPRPAPLRNSTQVGSRTSVAALAPEHGGGSGEGGSGGGGGGGAAPAGEAAPARQGTDRGGRRRREQQEEELEEDARRRRRPARESKVGAGGCARGPGGAVARAPARRTLAGRMGGGAPGPPPPAACASAQRRGRKAAGARPLGRCVAVGLRPGRSP